MTLPIFFPVVEDTIDETGLPIIKSAATNKSSFGGPAFKHTLLPNGIGGTVVASNHIGGNDSETYKTQSEIVPHMALVYNGHGGVVTPDYGTAIVTSSDPFNFAGIALSATSSVADSWSEEFTAITPSPRGQGAMVYDKSSSRITMFGGTNGVELGETWEYSGTQWVQKITTHSPSGRISHAMAHDITRNRSVLYGGSNSGSSGLAETWEWSTVDWTNVSAGQPGGLTLHAMGYGTLQPGTGSQRSVTVLFGGQTPSTTLNGLLSAIAVSIPVTLSTGFPTTGQLIIGTEQITYTGISGNTFTGCIRGANGTTASIHSNGTSVFGILNNTWEWNGTNWTLKTPSISPNMRSGHCMAYDSTRAKMVMFGGSLAPSFFSSVIQYNDTWEYDGYNWKQILIPGVLPSPRVYSKLVYNPIKKVMVMFGGFDITTFTVFSDTWEYDGFSWTQINILGPSSRAAHMMAYDMVQNKVVLFGGLDRTLQNYDGDTWELNSPVFPVLAQIAGEGTVYYDSTGIYPIAIGNVSRTSGVVTITTSLVNSFLSGDQFILTSLTTSDSNFSSGTKTIASIVDGYNFTYTEAGSNSVSVKPLIVRTIVGRLVPVIGDFLGPSAVSGTITSVFDGNSPVFGHASDVPIIDPLTSNLFQAIVNSTRVGLIKMRVGAFYGFIPPISSTITNMSPLSGVVGSSIIMTGVGFIGTQQVSFDGTPAQSATYSIISNNQILITVPAGAQTGTVSVVSVLGTTTSSQNFAVIPSIVNVAAVSQAVGAAVTITGYTFTHVTSIKFNATNQPSFTIVDDSTITTTIVSGATSGSVTVTDADGTGTFVGFTVVAPPIISGSGIAPSTGAVGSFMSITGSGFIAAGAQIDGYGTLDFIPVATTLNGSINDSITTITVISTTGFPTTGVLFINSEQIAYTGISPTTFTGCTRAYNGTLASSHLNGAAVGMTTGSSITNITRAVFSDVQISVTIPNPGIPQPSVAYYVRFTTSGGVATSAQTYIIVPRPTFPVSGVLNAFSPSTGSAGAIIDIFGQYGFTGASAVSFDGYAANFSFVSDTHITAIVPVATGVTSPVPINITSTGGIRGSSDGSAAGSGPTSPQFFTILQQPTIIHPNDFTPTQAATATTITIVGNNFLSLMAEGHVFFHKATAVALSGQVSRASNIVTANTSASHGFTTGEYVLVNWQVSPLDGYFPSIFAQITVVDSDTFTYTQNGANATSSVAITFADAGTGSAAFTVVNNSIITVIVPAGSTGITSGAITVVAGTATPLFAISTASFTYLPTPAISSLSTSSGGWGSGGGAATQVIISGANLINSDSTAPVVRFGGVIAGIITSSPTSVTAVVPNGAVNGISLQTDGGTTSSSFNVVLPPVIYNSTPTINCFRNLTPIYINGTNFVQSNSTHQIFFYHGALNSVAATYANTQIVVNSGETNVYYDLYGGGNGFPFTIYVYVYYSGGYYAVTSPQTFVVNYCV